MDEVRLSLDTTNQAFDDFLDAASVVNNDLITGVSEKQLTEDKEIFRKARRDMDSKLAIETPRIRQAMPLDSGKAFMLSSGLIRIGIFTITDCINSGKVVDVDNAGIHTKRVECQNLKQFFSVKYADERIAKVQACVSEIYYSIRPSPFDDLNYGKIVNNISHTINNMEATCNGITMLGMSYDKTYGKYINPSNSLLQDN